MYNHSTIQSCLRGLVGFQNSYNTESYLVDSDLLASSSGLYINNSLHPLLTHENILSVAEQFSKTSVRAWDGTFTYAKNNIVKKSDKYWYSLKETNLNHDPEEVSSTWWTETTLYSAFLRKLYDGASIKLFSSVFTEKKMNGVAKSLLANVNLYEGVGNINNRITKSGRVVGFKIKILHPDTVALLNYIGMQVDTIQNPINIYLYHTSSDVPIATIALNHTKSVQFQWHKITQKILSVMDDVINAGGYWYICYYEDELTGEAIKKEISFSGKQVCGSCSDAVMNNQLYHKWSKFIKIQPFYVNSDDIDTVDHKLWNEEKELFIDDSTFGLNLQMNIQCDMSNWLCQNSNLFADALSKQIVCDLLNEMTFSLRDNQAKQKLAGLAAVALDNQENGQEGEMKKLKNAIKAMSIDFSSLSDVCNPCEKQASTRLRTVWN